ncbi:MAG: hypothetical protein GC181_05840 [Bacteroidetes bacterium]|nr:hypothetical protein [Bacteroidota bacterium]
MNADWWNSLDGFARVYWLIAIPFSVAFLIQLVMVFTGTDTDADADLDLDAEMDADHGTGFQFFTLKNLIAFFTIFGWIGIACINGGTSKGLTILFSTIAGLMMMAVMSTILYFMGKLTYNGSLNMKNATGLTGEVYLRIPGGKKGYGKVHIKVQGSLRELEAMTNGADDLATGVLVMVDSVTENNILIVSPLN